MKNLPAIFLLLLITTQTVYSFSFTGIIFGFLMSIYEIVKDQFFYEECPGVCVPNPLTFLCHKQNIDRTVSCPNVFFRSKCCAFRPLLQTTTKTTEADYLDDFITASPVDRLDGPNALQDDGSGMMPPISDKPVEIQTTTTPPNDEKKNSTEQTTSTKVNERVKCKGECVSGLFSLLCDYVDEEGACPSEGTCCLQTRKDESNVTSTTQSIPIAEKQPSSTKTSDATTEKPASKLRRRKVYLGNH